MDPEQSLIDTPPKISVRGVPPGSVITLAIVTADAAGHGWRSSGEYRTEPDGSLDVDDPDRPWWDMAFNDSSVLPVAFTAPVGALRYQLTATLGEESATATTTRIWGKDVVTEAITGTGWRLHLFRPDSGSALGSARAGVVIVPGANGGGVTAAAGPTAALLASRGHTAAVLAYVQEAGLPPYLSQIPLEAINDAIRAFAALADVQAARVTVLAYSVGTSVALTALTRPDAPVVRQLIVVSPTHVVWQALAAGGRFPKLSSLTLGGQDLHYVPLRSGRLMSQVVGRNLLARVSEKRRSAALRMMPAYRAGLQAAAAVDAATIPVERISASMMIVAGDQDAVWPAAEMARSLADRRGDRPDDLLMILPGAGHVLRPPATPTTVARDETLVSGGTPAGTAAGQRVAWDTMLQRITA